MRNPYGNTHDCDSSMAHPRAMTHEARRPMAGSAVTKGKTLGHGDWQPPRLSVWNQQWPPSTTMIQPPNSKLFQPCSTYDTTTTIIMMIQSNQYSSCPNNNTMTLLTIIMMKSKWYFIYPTNNYILWYYLKDNTDDTAEAILYALPNTKILRYSQ